MEWFEEIMEKYRKPARVSTPPYQTEVRFEGFSCRLRRLSDSEYRDFSESAIHFSHSGWTEHWLSRSRPSLTLGHFYVTFEDLTGETSALRDGFKSTFLFPFFLGIKRASAEYDYLVRVLNYRSYVETKFSRLILPDDPRNPRRDFLFPPIEEELPKGDMASVCAFFWGLVEGYTSKVPKDFIRPFVKCVKSNLLIFGFENNSFFEEQFSDWQICDQRFSEIQARISAGNSSMGETPGG